MSRRTGIGVCVHEEGGGTSYVVVVNILVASKLNLLLPAMAVMQAKQQAKKGKGERGRGGERMRV